jgi:hypothetical protein
MKSYFKYFENKRDDWFIVSRQDIFSTTFELKGDEILLENRSFRFEVGVYFANVLNTEFSSETITLEEMYKIVSKLYGKNANKMMTMTRHPTKNKFTRKLLTVLERTHSTSSKPNSKTKTAKTKKR